MYKKTIKKSIVFDGDVVEAFENNILNQTIKKDVKAFPYFSYNKLI